MHHMQFHNNQDAFTGRFKQNIYKCSVIEANLVHPAQGLATVSCFNLYLTNSIHTTHTETYPR